MSWYNTMILTIKSIQAAKTSSCFTGWKSRRRTESTNRQQVQDTNSPPRNKTGMKTEQGKSCLTHFSLSRSQFRWINSGETLKQRVGTDLLRNVSLSQKLETKINLFSAKYAGFAKRAVMEVCLNTTDVAGPESSSFFHLNKRRICSKQLVQD